MHGGEDMSNNQYEDVNESLEKAKSTAKTVSGKISDKLGFNPLKKLKRKITNKIKKLIKHGIKVLVKSILSLLSALAPLLIGFVVIVIVIGILGNIFNFFEFDDRASKGDFKGDINDVTIKEDDTNDTSLGNTLAILFYTRFSTQSYYYTVDDDSTVKQASADSKVKDFEEREKMFALSPGLLSSLDKYLNDGFKYPEQFIKPVYNTCSTGESKDGKCELKNLENDKGKLVVKSKGYEKVKDKDKSGMTYYKISDKDTAGVWDWGLAPILHYKKFDQRYQVQDYKVQSVQIYDRDSREIKTVAYDKLTEQQRKDLSANSEVMRYILGLPTTVERADSEDKRINGIPKSESTYAIDKVTSFLGDIDNSLSQKWVYDSNYVNTDNPIRYEKWYEGEDVKKEDLTDTNMVKKVRLNGIKIYEGNGNIKYINETKVASDEQKKECKDKATYYDKVKKKDVLDKEKYEKCVAEYEHIEGYEIDGRLYAGRKKDFSIASKVSVDLRVTRTGNLMKHTVQYDDGEPNLSSDAGLKYLKTYISNYTAFFPFDNSVEQKYYCLIVDGRKDEVLSKSLSEMKSNDMESVSKLLKAIDLNKLGSSLLKVDNAVSTPNKCGGDTIAVADNSKLMKEFFSEDIPIFQYLAISKGLGLNVVSGDKNISASSIGKTLSEIGIRGKSNKAEELRSNSKIYKYFKEFSDTYGIDINLAMAVAIASSDGDTDYNKSASGLCTNDGGCGLMGIKTLDYNGPNISAYNFKTRKKETFASAINKDAKMLSKKDLMKTENNIRYGCMLLQNYFYEYKNNYAISLQAYDYGNESIKNLMNYYEDTEGVSHSYTLQDVSDFGWTAYRKEASANPNKYMKIKKKKWGNPEFIEAVLSNFGTLNDFSIRMKNNGYYTADFSALKSDTAEGDSKLAFTDKVMNLYLRKGDSFFDKNWDILYLGQKSFDAGTYKFNSKGGVKGPDKAQMIEYKYKKSESDIDNTIKAIFAFQEGSSIAAFDDLSDEYWKTKYSEMFKTAGSKAWEINYAVERVFSGTIGYPVKNPVITRSFGYSTSETGKSSLSTETEILAAKGEKVSALASGEVISVKKDSTGAARSLVTIVNNKGSTSDEDKADDDKTHSVAGVTTGTYKDVASLKDDEIINKLNGRLQNDLAGKGKEIAEISKEKDIDPFLFAAILTAETSGKSPQKSNGEPTYNFGNLECNANGAIGCTNVAPNRWAIFADLKSGLEHTASLLHVYVHDKKAASIRDIGLAGYCEDPEKVWIPLVTSIYKEFAGQEYNGKSSFANLHVEYAYYDLTNIKVKVGDKIKVGDTIGYVSEKNHFSMSLLEDNKFSSIDAVFKALDDAKARERVYASIGGKTGSTSIGIDVDGSSYASMNPFTQANLIGQCTWYAWGRANQVLHKSLPFRGDAQSWYGEAQQSGYKVSQTPSVRALAIWSSGPYGHVAFIEEFDGKNVTISEGNFNSISILGYQIGYGATLGEAKQLLHKTTMTIEEIKSYCGMELLGYIILE